MLSCREVARTVAGDELAGAGWRRKLSVRLHLLMCRHCRSYARQLESIGAVAREVFGTMPEDEEIVARLRRTVLEQIPDPDAGTSGSADPEF